MLRDVGFGALGLYGFAVLGIVGVSQAFYAT